MKLVVAGVNDEGRSYVESTTELDDTRVIHVWDGALEDVAERVAAMTADPHLAAIEPPVGGVKWVYNRIPPVAEAERYGYRNQGMHATRTVDFDFLIDGELHCVLDEETVELAAGDFIILRAANHMWFNPGSVMATMLIVLHHPAVPATTS